MSTTKACELSLAAAVAEYERRRPEDDPDWFQYFDEAELSAEFGHCLRDLGQARALRTTPGAASEPPRTGGSRAATSSPRWVLADAHLAAGGAEQAPLPSMDLHRSAATGRR